MKSHPVVLIAEDDPVFRRVIAFSLAKAGFECLTASNGQEAFSIAENADVDLMVTDHQMPICSGLELIQKIRQHAMLSQLPIVLCTAKGFELNAAELISAYQLIAVMRKPFSPRQMISLISAYLNSPISSSDCASEDRALCDRTGVSTAAASLQLPAHSGATFAALPTAAPNV